MARKQKNPLELNIAQKEDALGLIRKYLREEWDEEIGDLKAELFWSFLQEKMGKLYYNKGVEDAQRFWALRTEDMMVDLDQLKQP